MTNPWVLGGVASLVVVSTAVVLIVVLGVFDDDKTTSALASARFKLVNTNGARRRRLLSHGGAHLTPDHVFRTLRYVYMSENAGGGGSSTDCRLQPETGYGGVTNNEPACMVEIFWENPFCRFDGAAVTALGWDATTDGTEATLTATRDTHLQTLDTSTSKNCIGPTFDGSHCCTYGDNQLCDAYCSSGSPLQRKVKGAGMWDLAVADFGTDVLNSQGLPILGKDTEIEWASGFYQGAKFDTYYTLVDKGITQNEGSFKAVKVDWGSQTIRWQVTHNGVNTQTCTPTDWNDSDFYLFPKPLGAGPAAGGDGFLEQGDAFVVSLTYDLTDTVEVRDVSAAGTCSTGCEIVTGTNRYCFRADLVTFVPNVEIIKPDGPVLANSTMNFESGGGCGAYTAADPTNTFDCKPANCCECGDAACGYT